MARKRSTPGGRVAELLWPVLEAVRDLGGSARPKEVYERVSTQRGLTDAQRSVLTGSGAPQYEVDIAWARHYLVRTGLLDSSRHGVWALTAAGRACEGISTAQAQEMVKRVRSERTSSSADGTAARRGPAPTDDDDPDGRGPDSGSTSHRAQVLRKLQSLSPTGFEHFCQRLLREAGFENVVVCGGPGDQGIDGEGILCVNALVSFRVLFQCKRYEGNVSAGDVTKFRGSMSGRTDKAIILTTGGFTPAARREAARDGVARIELVDGSKLVDMLESLEIGVQQVKTFRLDEAFFQSFC